MSDYPYIDLHSHLQFDDFENDREDIISEMRAKNVISLLIGTDNKSSKKAIELAEKYPDIFWAVPGIHPLYAEQDKEIQYLDKVFFQNKINKDKDKDKEKDKDKKKQKENKNNFKKIIGVGEIGLDFFREENQKEENKKIQKEVFQDQIDFAKKNNMPIMLHIRNAYEETLDILYKNFNHNMQYSVCVQEKAYNGNAHFFIGSIEQAKRFIELGFSLSFTGVITFVKEYEELVREIPLEYMYAETDSPYVSPKPYRGKKNNPTHVIEIYKKIADIKGITVKEVREVFYKNACKQWFSML